MDRLAVQFERDRFHGIIYDYTPPPISVNNSKTDALAEINCAYEPLLGAPRNKYAASPLGW